MKTFILLSILVASAFSGAIELSADDFTNGNVSNGYGQNSGTWFIKFYNPRCPHCGKFAPVWDKLADEFSQKENIMFGSLNCSANRQICGKFNVYAVPTLLIFKNNKYVECEYADYDFVSKYLNLHTYDSDLQTQGMPIPAIN